MLIMTFKSGKSGNPHGRPKGTGYRQQLFNKLVDPHKEALFETAINLALNGNEAMLRLFLERMLPAKPSDETLNLKPLKRKIQNKEELFTFSQNILGALSNNEITPAQAKSIMIVVEANRKLIETCNPTNNMSVIEQILQYRNSNA